MRRVTLGGWIAVVSQFLPSVAVGVLVEAVCVCVCVCTLWRRVVCSFEYFGFSKYLGLG